MFVQVKLPTLLMVKLPRRVMPPIEPEIVIVPVPAASVRSPPPSMVEEKVMFWLAAAVVTVALPETVTALKNWTAPATVIELERTATPFWVKAPAMLPVAAEL